MFTEFYHISLLFTPNRINKQALNRLEGKFRRTAID